MGDFEILYICDRKVCENCHEECQHTSDINHAVNRNNLNGRMFQFVEGCNKSGLFEMQSKEDNKNEN